MAIKNTTIPKPQIGRDHIQCQRCGKLKVNKSFYASNSKSVPKYPVCKTCLADIIDIGDIQTVYDVLQDMDVIFVRDIWKDKKDNHPTTAFGHYLRQVSTLKQYSGKRWSDSDFEQDEEDYDFDVDFSFDISREVRMRWGKQKNSHSYYHLEEFYHNMKRDNKVETAQEEAYLIKIAKLNLEIDVAFEAHDWDTAKKLGDLFSKYMADSEFRASDKTDADKSGGVRTWSQAYAEMEREDFIPPWESHFAKIFKVGQDIIDKTIMYILNAYFKNKNIPTMEEPPMDTPKVDGGDE